MRLLKLSLFLFLIICSTHSYAQHVCGTQDQHVLIERMQQNRATMSETVFERGGITYVPILWHVVTKSDGTGGIAETRIFDQMCVINEEYADQDIQFYMYEDFDYINNSSAFESPASFGAIAAMISRREDEAINIYVCNTANTGSGGVGTTLGYYSPGQDWIVIRKANVNGSSSNNTVPHELGHYFNLPHTFFGWEGEPYQTGVTPNPVPNFAPGTSVPTEYQNGSNCTVAADQICDTPPDYNFGILDNNGGCQPYNKGAMDPGGTIVDPMENNFMAYFDNCSDYEFTNGQKTVISQALSSPQRQVLDTDFVPGATTFPNDPVLNWPEAHDNGGGNTAVDFDWDDVAGATGYFVQIARNAGYTIQAQQMYVTASQATFPDLVFGANYFWRVKPYNAYYTCASYTQAQYEVGMTISVNNIDVINNWKVEPNLLSKGTPMKITVETTEQFDGAIKVVDISGQLVFQQSASFLNGASVQYINTGNFENGIYLLQLVKDGAIETKRFIIAR